ncbi:MULTISPECIES: DUF4136 domain-containing protein [Microbulbifer]|uniref:DUF4136 domain-containing protein n=1 Tax=Microbulbifer celer TaxID=435905 RepID=A0ABW3U8X7_9GAMM|nr:MULTISPECIES: DUF4136 domain-containing protein [Microbulbifer]UFN57464.1 DUF4136 domain-containing protein [Microbulbifer celer]
MASLFHILRLNSLRFRGACIAALGLWLAGCAASNPVAVDYDPAFKFANLRSYYMLDPLASGPVSPFEIKRARQAIDNQLRGRYTPAESRDQADFLVRVQLMSSDKVAVYEDPFSLYGGYGYFGLGWRAPLRVREYTQSTLVVDVSSADDAPLWRGSLPSKAAGFDDPRRQLQRFNEEAALIIGRFPPYNDVGYD